MGTENIPDTAWKEILAFTGGGSCILIIVRLLLAKLIRDLETLTKDLKAVLSKNAGYDKSIEIINKDIDKLKTTTEYHDRSIHKLEAKFNMNDKAFS